MGPWFKFRARPMFEVAFEVRLGWIREPYTRARGMWGQGQGRDDSAAKVRCLEC